MYFIWSFIGWHYIYPLFTGRGTGTETHGIGNVFPPDDLWISLDTYKNCILIYDLLGEGVAYGGLSLPVVLYRMLPIFTLYEMSII